MRFSTLEYTDQEAIFSQLQEQLKGTVSYNCGEYLINVDNEFANGTVRCVKVQNHKLFFEFDLKFYKDFELRICDQQSSPVNFMYNLNDQITLSLQGKDEEYTLEEFQTAIIFDKHYTPSFKFQADTTIKVCLISVYFPHNMEEASAIVSNIYSSFAKNSESNNFIYLGSYNIKIATQIKKLNEITEEGIVRKLLIVGMVQLILAMEIQHQQDDLNNAGNPTVNLTKLELKSIRDLAQEINEHVDVQYTLNYLTHKSCISAAKLQEGFKYLYGRTVTDYIRNVRLERAEQLIKTTDLNISEVVYSVGFSSRSYFSKIFKEKYSCSPKQYQDKLNYPAISA
ncbi:hypothetical protein GCM10022393_42170 [Aquimarina addita]|uniref:HTH araC/xylS-type domain-containing protein n=1 Tax=Aquimarina addita TaxID=870485 RepID=A0ABP6UVJ0_9FLAO